MKQTKVSRHDGKKNNNQQCRNRATKAPRIVVSFRWQHGVKFLHFSVLLLLVVAAHHTLHAHLIHFILLNCHLIDTKSHGPLYNSTKYSVANLFRCGEINFYKISYGAELDPKAHIAKQHTNSQTHTHTEPHEMPPNITRKFMEYVVRFGVDSMKFHRRLFQARIIIPPLYPCVHAAKSPHCSRRNQTFG